MNTASGQQTNDERLIARLRELAASKVTPESVEQAVGKKPLVNTRGGFPLAGLQRVDFQPHPAHPNETITLENATDVVYWPLEQTGSDVSVVGLQFWKDGTAAVFFAVIGPP